MQLFARLCTLNAKNKKVQPVKLAFVFLDIFYSLHYYNYYTYTYDKIMSGGGKKRGYPTTVACSKHDLIKSKTWPHIF